MQVLQSPFLQFSHEQLQDKFFIMVLLSKDTKNYARAIADLQIE